jgi:hypothetical protein
MTAMHRYGTHTIGLAAFLLLIFTAGCSDPDQSSTPNPTVTPPTAISEAPPSAAPGACPSTVVTVTFSKAMNPATIDGATFTLTGPGPAAVVGVVSYDAPSDTATFSPTAGLALNTLYSATVTTGAQDMYGNGLANNFVWSFTTGNTACQAGPPTVVSLAPANGVNGVCPNTVALATFSEAMNPATINSTTFTLTGPAAASVTGQVAYDAADYVATSAANFEALAGSTVTNTGPTIITGGDLGLSPGSAVTGFPPGTLTPPAVMHITDPTAAQAELDLTTAYLYTAGLPGGAVLPGDMSGLTFAPGLYMNASTVMLSAGNVTLDAGGDVNAVFIFQVGSTLTTIGSTQVILAGGAQAQNVFWQVSSSATLGTNSIFQGTIMSLQSISLDTGATLIGRALARNGAVTLDDSTLTAP